jgi:hypothetical protein
MDQLQGSRANDNGLAFGTHDRRACEKSDPEGGNEFTTADPGCHQGNSCFAALNATNMPTEGIWEPKPCALAVTR